MEGHRGGLPSSQGDLLGIVAGTGVQGIDGTVRMAQLLNVVGSRGQAGDGNLTAAVRGVGPGYQRGAGRIGVNAKPPAGEVLSVLGGFGQPDGSLGWGFQLKVGVEISTGSTAQGNGCLVAGAGHIPEVIGGTGGRGQIPGSLEHRGLGDGSGLGDFQGAAAFTETGPAAIGETEIGQHPVGIRHGCGCTVQGDGGRIAHGRGSKAGNLLCCLDVTDQGVIVGGKPGHRGFPRIVKHVPGGSALIFVVSLKGAGVSQSTDNLVDEELGGNSQGDVGIAVLPGSRDADGVIPHLVTVKKDKANGFPAGCRHSIPDIAAGSASAAAEGHILVNGVAGGAGSIIAPGLDAVQGIVRVGHTPIPGKVPAKIFDVRCPGSAAAVRLVGAGHLRVKDCGVVAIVGIVKEHYAALATADGKHIRIFRKIHGDIHFRGIFRHGFGRDCWFCIWSSGFFRDSFSRRRFCRRLGDFWFCGLHFYLGF